MKKCSRCQKRLAVIFVSNYGDKDKKPTGICLTCAKELGLPIDSLIENAKEIGYDEENLALMETEIFDMITNKDDGSNVSFLKDENFVDMTEEFEKMFPNALDKKSKPKNPKNSSDLIRDSNDSDNGNGNTNLPSQSGKPDDLNEFFENLKASKKKTQNSSESGEDKRKFLNQYCKNLTRSAKEGKLDRIVGRQKELARVIQILSRRQKNNPCLIGEPGVGKTAIAEALALKIVAGDVPYKLLKKEIFLLDLTALVAGTQYRGQFEARIQSLIKEVNEDGNIILVIDEVHNIASAGDAEGSMNAANIMKPALSRGEIQVIGATTLAEYRKHIEKDSALERRFQPVMVNEPSIDESYEMLRGIKHYYEEFHGVNISDEIVKQSVVLSERFITDRNLPDKAIDLLDEASAYVSLANETIGESHKIREELKELKAKREAVALLDSSESGFSDEEKYKRLADIKVSEIRLNEKLDEIEKKASNLEVTQETLAAVIETWTGVPASSITESEFIRIDNISARLKSRIIGQDEAVDAVARAIKRNRAGVSYKRKPVSFIFAGPTGVGKTELVKTLAQDLFNTPENLIRLDMSEFMEKHSVSRIIGAPPGYVGYDESGQLTEKIRRRPYSVILFDEIEKAHPDVLNIMLQILDDGRVTDAHGRQVNFENTVVIMTTNAGSDRSSSTAGFTLSNTEKNKDQTNKSLSSFLRPEFLNRVDEIITFKSLSRDNFKEIVKIMLADLQKALGEKDITLKYTDAAADYVAEKSFSEKFGARNMRRFIQTEIEDKLASDIISSYNRKITHVMIDIKDEKIVITSM